MPPASIRATLNPAAARRRATVMPAGPEPITHASNSKSMALRSDPPASISMSVARCRNEGHEHALFRKMPTSIDQPPGRPLNIGELESPSRPHGKKSAGKHPYIHENNPEPAHTRYSPYRFARVSARHPAQTPACKAPRNNQKLLAPRSPSRSAARPTQ